MKKNNIFLLLCIVIIVALSAFYFINKTKKENEIVDEPTIIEEYHDISIVDLEQLKSVTIDGVESMTFEKATDEKWFETNNKSLVLNQNTLSSIANGVVSIKSAEVVVENASDDKLDEYGLKTPLITVTSLLKDNKTVKFFIGKQTPAQDNYYLMSEKDKNVYLLSSYTLDVFNTSLIDLVDKAIVFPDLNAINYMRFAKKDSIEVELVEHKNLDEATLKSYTEAGRVPLIMSKPIKDRTIYEENVSKMILEPFSLMYLDSIHEIKQINDDVFYGFDKPLLDITTNDATTNLNLIFGKEIDNGLVYVKYVGREQVFLAKKTLIDALLAVKPFSIFDRFIALINIVDVDRITLTSGSRTNIIDIKHRLEQGIEEKDDVIVEEGFIDNIAIVEEPFKKLYQIIIGLSYDSVPETMPTIDEKPEVTLEYKMSTESKNMVENQLPDIKVEFFSYSDDFYLVKRNDIFENIINKSALANLFKEIDALLADTSSHIK